MFLVTFFLVAKLYVSHNCNAIDTIKNTQIRLLRQVALTPLSVRRALYVINYARSCVFVNSGCKCGRIQLFNATRPPLS